ncbi:RteC protein [Mucilaginibacter gracilis]|uniref:RteC protein n=1 Tax=Mucilaginibacter gracilis TaxID=423350 RepID=A0A495IVE4_9SPHI|nr:RteC domain-containing protein [Mucilaginibacter gracilis]RKR79984.1 RteC protein [Mucilaginibacter gracilis]
MLRKYYEERYAEFLREMAKVAEAYTDGMDRLAASIACIKKYLKELRDYVVKKGFKDDAEEIWCFKEAKPELMSWYIYHTEWQHIIRRLPVGDDEMVNHYFLNEIRAIDRYLEMVAFFHHYYKMKATEIDHVAFIRGKSLETIILPELAEIDPEFSTCCDYVFAKIMAYERLKERLLEEVRLPDLGIRDIDLRWTGDACNLVEVIYGLYDTKQLNHGKAELQEIANFFEEIFKVKLDRFYRRFTEVKERKVLSPTNYLDQMRDAIMRRVEDDLSLKPKRKHP